MNYLEALKPKDQELVQAKTERIRALMGTTAEGIYEIGKELLHVKTILGHGHFLSWLEDQFEWSERTARNFMAVALKLERPAQNGKICQFAPSALYLLASDSTPEKARKEAEKLADEGMQITYSVAEDLKEKHQVAEAAFDGLTPEEQEEIAEKMAAPKGPDWRAERNKALRAALAAARKIERTTPKDRAIRQRLERWLVKPKART